MHRWQSVYGASERGQNLPSCNLFQLIKRRIQRGIKINTFFIINSNDQSLIEESQTLLLMSRFWKNGQMCQSLVKARQSFETSMSVNESLLQRVRCKSCFDFLWSCVSLFQLWVILVIYHRQFFGFSAGPITRKFQFCIFILEDGRGRAYWPPGQGTRTKDWPPVTVKRVKR